MTQKKVKIPFNLRNNELYSTAQKFKCNRFSDIKLFYNAELLYNDDTLIDLKSNVGFIKINESLDIDESFYKTLLQKYKDSELIYNIRLHGNDGKTLIRHFPKVITVKEMIKAFLMEMKIPIYLISNFYIMDL